MTVFSIYGFKIYAFATLGGNPYFVISELRFGGSLLYLNPLKQEKKQSF